MTKNESINVMTAVSYPSFPASAQAQLPAVSVVHPPPLPAAETEQEVLYTGNQHNLKKILPEIINDSLRFCLSIANSMLRCNSEKDM